MKIVINAENGILGRIAAYAAKQALLGNEIAIVNVEKAVISGGKRHTLAEAKRKKKMGVPRKGPFYSRLADRYVRRVVRGMLPYKQPRGRAAFERVMCYVGVTDELKGTMTTVPGADAKKLPNLKRITVAEICKEFGGKHYGEEER